LLGYCGIFKIHSRKKKCLFFNIQNFEYLDLGYYIHFLDKSNFFCKVWWLKSTIILVCRMTWYFLLPIVKEFLSKWIETHLSNKVVSELYEYNTLTTYQILCGWYIHISYTYIHTHTHTYVVAVFLKKKKEKNKDEYQSFYNQIRMNSLT
jgi:uncharacterized membrane protein (DUF485 family)